MNVLIENALTLSKIRKLLKTNCVYTDEHNISTIIHHRLIIVIIRGVYKFKNSIIS